MKLSPALPVHQNSFWTQYTSLILIVLTFIIAVSFAPQAFKKTKGPTPTEYRTVSTMEFKNLFDGDSNALKKENLYGLTYALLNHDLNSEIYVHGTSAEIALARSTVLFRHLISQGVPAHAVASYAVTVDQHSASSVDAKVVIYDAVR